MYSAEYIFISVYHTPLNVQIRVCKLLIIILKIKKYMFLILNHILSLQIKNFPLYNTL